MHPVQIVFPRDYDKRAVLARLSQPDSGFEIDPRAPMHSGVEIGLAIAGLVLSAAQLAVALLQLKSSRSAAETEPEVVTIVWPDGRRQPVTLESAGQVERQLSSAMAPGTTR